MTDHHSEREAIARIIDPDAFKTNLHKVQGWQATWVSWRQGEAFIKTAAILALLSSPRPADTPTQEQPSWPAYGLSGTALLNWCCDFPFSAAMEIERLRPSDPSPVAVGELECVADAIDLARYQHPREPRERDRPFSEADRTDREYAFRLARAAIRALSAAPKAPAGEAWQPIETAPWTLDVVLLYQPSGPGTAEAVGQGHRTSLNEHAHDKWVFQATGWIAEPTHWRPMPAPPTKSDGRSFQGSLPSGESELSVTTLGARPSDPLASDPADAMYDRAWDAILKCDELKRARSRLSIHEIRLIIRAALTGKTTP